MTATHPEPSTPNPAPNIEPGHTPEETPPPMTDPSPQPGAPTELPPPSTTPEIDFPPADNSEQDDEPSQAHTVSEDALDRTTAMFGSEDSDKPSDTDAGAVNPDDTPDLIDTMEQMTSSGRIDYGAFRGERSDDDETSTYGALPDEDRDIKLSDE
jgi:hypothetical protein